MIGRCVEDVDREPAVVSKPLSAGGL